MDESLFLKYRFAKHCIHMKTGIIGRALRIGVGNNRGKKEESEGLRWGSECHGHHWEHQSTTQSEETRFPRQEQQQSLNENLASLFINLFPSRVYFYF